MSVCLSFSCITQISLSAGTSPSPGRTAWAASFPSFLDIPRLLVAGSSSFFSAAITVLQALLYNEDPELRISC